MCQKAQLLRGRTSKAIRTFGIEKNQSNIVIDHRQALRIWEKYIQDLYDLENCPKDNAIEAEEELNENCKGPTILKSEVVNAIKDLRRKKVTRNDNIPAMLLKELGDSGLKIMTALVNKIYMNGDFLDVTIIALPKKNSDHRKIKSDFTHRKDCCTYFK